jgi:hypothetical protein
MGRPRACVDSRNMGVLSCGMYHVAHRACRTKVMSRNTSNQYLFVTGRCTLTIRTSCRTASLLKNVLTRKIAKTKEPASMLRSIWLGSRNHCEENLNGQSTGATVQERSKMGNT